VVPAFSGWAAIDAAAVPPVLEHAFGGAAEVHTPHAQQNDKS